MNENRYNKLCKGYGRELTDNMINKLENIDVSEVELIKQYLQNIDDAQCIETVDPLDFGVDEKDLEGISNHSYSVPFEELIENISKETGTEYMDALDAMIEIFYYIFEEENTEES